jgi:hypothetical protein
MKKHKKIIIFISCFFLLSVIGVNALEDITLNISLDKNVYSYDDTVRPVVTIHNYGNTSVILDFYEEIRNIDEKIPPYFISPKQIMVPAKTSLNASEIYFVVTDFNPSGEYQVKAEVRENNVLLSSINRTFTINSFESLNLDILTCKDSACTEKSKFFLQNENIYLDYSSELENISVLVTLTYPDKTTKQTTLPTSIIAQQIVTYNLEVTASKSGYEATKKTEELIEEVAVLKKERDSLLDEIDNLEEKNKKGEIKDEAI